MDRDNTDRDARSPGLGAWLRAIVSGLIVMCGVVFVCVFLPFALRLVSVGFAFFWVLLGIGVLLGSVLGIMTARQTLRLASRHGDRENVDRQARP